MKSVIYLFSIFLISFIPAIVLSADIKRIGIDIGLSSNYVVSISQDKKGFLWFATESGLNRFDGNKFKIYKKKDFISSLQSISGNELNKVYADKHDDVVWIATQREGLNMFDCKTENFIHYRQDKNNKQGIVTNDITDITNAKDGNIWISTYYRGVEYFNKKTKTFKHYNSTTIPQIASNSIWSVNEDNKGFLYIGHVKSGLSILSLKDKKIKNYKNDPNNPESLPGDEVKTIFIDKNENVWIGTNNGLALFNPETESFVVFRHDSSNKNSLISNYIYSIVQMKDGQLWIGTEKGGVSILDIRQSMFLQPEHVIFKNISYSDDYSGLSNSTVRSIFQDSFDNIWLATYGGGINFISHYPIYFKTWQYSPIPSLHNTLSNPVAWGTTVDKLDRVWIGTDGGGIDVFEKGTKVKTLDKNNSPLIDNAILSAIRDSDNNLWFGTFRGGVVIFDSQYKIISRFQIDNKNTDIRCFYEDTDKKMLLGTSSGLYEYDMSAKQGKLYSLESLKIPGNLVRAISKDDTGRIWIGTFGEGLTILEKDFKKSKTYKTGQGFPSNTIDYIYKDSQGRMWIATGDGLVLFENPSEISAPFKTFNELNGFKNTHVRAITEDKSNNIWISSNDGISRFIYGAGKFYHYDHYSGVPLGDFMSASVAKDSKGQIFFGSQNGLCYFDPEAIPTYINLPSTVITNFSVYNNESKLTDSEINIPISSVINLDYDQNTFSISFNVLDYALNNQVDYSYTLKGLEDRWYNTQEANTITFRNIPPGKYELLIRSKVKNQEWTDKVTSLVINIHPPLWLTWWAKSIYIILILVVVFFILRFYKRKLDLETSLTLEKRNHMQEQLLNDERLRFFTNITHELRTPLTLILGPLEDIQTDSALSDKHAAKISVIHKSAMRLLNLINQILDFRKTETQNKKLSVYKGDIAQLVQEIGLKYKELNVKAKVELNITIETNNTNIYFDSDIVGTILENLLSNAFKYTEEGCIVLTLREVDIDGFNYTELEVSDTGRGIPEDAMPHIFERYYQANIDRQVSGTGIGLALVHNLVQIHEGSITVDSKLGEGTVFRFRIDANNIYPNARHLDSAEVNVAEREIEQESVAVDSIPDNGKTIILVVEDDKDIRDYIQDSLSDQYTVYIAVNGIEGMEKALQYVPDVIVSDIMMPEMDGFELSRKLKEDVRTSHIPIILLTAKDTIQDRTEGYNLGVDSYLTKPFSAGLLSSRILNLLDTRKKLAELINKNRKDKKTIMIDALNSIDNEFIEKVTDIVEQNLDSDKIDVAFIAEKMNMSHSTLYRKIKALCGISVNEFIRKIRISNAEKFLLTGKYSISEISYMVGINSITYFRQCFKDEFGLVPSEYLKKIKNETGSETD